MKCESPCNSLSRDDSLDSNKSRNASFYKVFSVGELSQIFLTMFGSSFGGGTMQYPGTFKDIGMFVYITMTIISVFINFKIHMYLVEVAERHKYTSFSQISKLSNFKQLDIIISFSFVVSFFLRLMGSLSSINQLVPDMLRKLLDVLSGWTIHYHLL